MWRKTLSLGTVQIRFHDKAAWLHSNGSLHFHTSPFLPEATQAAKVTRWHKFQGLLPQWTQNTSPPEHFGPNAGFESIARCLLLYGDLTLRAPTTEYRASLWATLVLQTTEIQPGTRFRLFLIGCTVQLLCKSMDVNGYMERRELPNCSYQRHLNTISCSDNTLGFVKILGFYSVGKEGPIKFLWSILVY